MQFRAVLTVFAALLALVGCSAPSQQGAPPPSSSTATTTTAGPLRAPEPAVVTPVIANVVSAPVPVAATDGKVHLVYELQLTNVLHHNLLLTSVSVLDRDVALLDLSGDRLTHWTRLLGSPSHTTLLGPAQTAVVWLDVPLDGAFAIPVRLTHAVSVRNPEPEPPLFPAAQTVTVAPVDVQTRKPVEISPPLRGPNWMDLNGCCDTSAHRSALNPISGQLWGAERFAIDFLQLDADRRVVVGPPDKLESYKYFGADIHAVADGTVVGVLDGLPEQIPGKSPSGLPLDQYAGNHVVEDLGNGNYALYAHMKTGTVKVKPGDRLTTGQVIGAVGNTGNSSAPHLHFHVMSTPDPLRSDGLPFVFNDFRLDGRIPDTDDLDGVVSGAPAPLQPRFDARDESGVMPLELDVMTFGDR
jgi:hypothetical protein